MTTMLIGDVILWDHSHMLSEPAVGSCLRELVSGHVRKLQGTEAKVSDQTLPV
jgi:hypothetical protein